METAEEFLKKVLYDRYVSFPSGVELEAYLEAMESYHTEKLKEMMPTDEAIEEDAGNMFYLSETEDTQEAYRDGFITGQEQLKEKLIKWK